MVFKKIEIQLSIFLIGKQPHTPQFYSNLVMQHTPLVKVIQSLGKRERADLLRWVESPFVNRRPEVTRLCQHLCQTVPVRETTEGHSEELGKIEAYIQVFGTDRRDTRRAGKKSQNGSKIQKLSSAEDTALRYAMSFLFTAVKEWMAYREWSQDDTATGLMLCRSLRKRELNPVFEKEFKALQTAALQVRSSADFSFAQYQIQFEKLEFNIKRGQTDPVQLKKAADAFGVFVANIALMHGCAALNSSLEPFESIDYLPETLTKIEAGQFKEVPSIQVYYRSFRLMQANEETDYQQLKLLLSEQRDSFPSDEIRDPWNIALNYCIRRVNSGEIIWIQEALELYKSGLKGDLLLEKGLMPISMYQNIMLSGIGCDEWDWARQFIDDYRTALPVGERHNAYKFNLALWHFRRKDYLEAQEILLKVEFRDVYYNLDARRMMVCMYYDQGAFSALDSLLHSFRTYLLRHRNIGYRHHLYANFVRIVQQILRLSPDDKRAREQLREKIKTEKYLAEREWLLSVLG